MPDPIAEPTPRAKAADPARSAPRAAAARPPEVPFPERRFRAQAVAITVALHAVWIGGVWLLGAAPAASEEAAAAAPAPPALAAIPLVLAATASPEMPVLRYGPAPSEARVEAADPTESPAGPAAPPEPTPLLENPPSLEPPDVEVPPLVVLYADREELLAVARHFGEREVIIRTADGTAVGEVVSYEPLAVRAWEGPPPAGFGYRIKRRTAQPYFRERLARALEALRLPAAEHTLVALIPAAEDAFLAWEVLRALNRARIAPSAATLVRGRFVRGDSGFGFEVVEVRLSDGRAVRPPAE